MLEICTFVHGVRSESEHKNKCVFIRYVISLVRWEWYMAARDALFIVILLNIGTSCSYSAIEAV